MNGVFMIVKQTMRILLRNKGFIFFLIFLPIFSIALLNIKDFGDEEVKGNNDSVYVLDDMTERICYNIEYGMLAVKVYDSTGSSLGMEFSKELAKSGMLQVFYYDSEKNSEDEIQKNIDNTVENDRVGGIVYLNSGFAEALLNGEMTKGMCYYESDAEERADLITTAVSKVTGIYLSQAEKVEDEASLISCINTYEENQLKVQKKTIAVNEDLELTAHQKQQYNRLGYTIAILTISFLFCGVLIADTIIKEKQFKVYNRIKLTDLTATQYVFSKYIVSFISVLVQSAVIALALPLIVKQDYGISQIQLMIILTLLGFIFCTLSLCIGIVCNNVMNTNYIAFVIWTVSALLSGCYFRLDDAGGMVKRIANLMPQKWALQAIEKFLLDKGGAYGILVTATLAFLIIIGVLSIIGTKKGAQE